MSDPSKVEVAFAAFGPADEDLNRVNLVSRWKTSQGGGNAIFGLGLIYLCGGLWFVFNIDGLRWRALILLMATAAIHVAISRYLNRKARPMSSEEVILDMEGIRESRRGFDHL